MTVIRPFPSTRPAPEYASRIAALPYDVYTRHEAKDIVNKNPDSFLKIDSPDTLFPDTTDPFSPEVYAGAKATYEQMKQDHLFIQDSCPCLYLYRLTYKGRAQTGIVGCASIDDYQNGIIRRHENTRKEQELDRTRHVEALQAQTGPIFMIYRKDPALKAILDTATAAPTLYDFTSEDTVRHQVWRLSDPDVIEQIVQRFSGIPRVYIADGHHRALSAVNVGLSERERHPHYDGNEEFNFFLSVFFSEDDLRIYDYNRIVKDLNGLSTEGFISNLCSSFPIRKLEEGTLPHLTQKGEIGFYVDGQWYQLTIPADLYTTDPVQRLDVSILQDHILDPILGIENPKTDSRIQFVGGIRGLSELTRLVDEKEGRIAFAMYPTSMEELMAVADAGKLMPPKSTWFEPKLRSGLLIHEF